MSLIHQCVLDESRGEAHRVISISRTHEFILGENKGERLAEFLNITNPSVHPGMSEDKRNSLSNDDITNSSRGHLNITSERFNAQSLDTAGIKLVVWGGYD
mmetsp:Transcript_26121/g.38378  ORF Transcript_26121/g.38378 Transcript_26121/m.38378 type:complete len:101 (+) Transcript_26121:6-308(+)